MYSLKTTASFDSAHFLTNYYGKCENIHGHRWNATVYTEAKTLTTHGTEKDMVLDFALFKKIVREVANELDHTFFIEEGSLQQKTIDQLKSEGFDLKILPFRTTSENLAKFFAEEVEKKGITVSKIEMAETPNNCAIYKKMSE